MGQAKSRGTFEERRALAVEKQKLVKKQRVSKSISRRASLWLALAGSLLKSDHK